MHEVYSVDRSGQMKTIHTQNSNFDMKDIKFSGGTAGKWAPASCQREYFSWSWGKFSVVLGAIQRVKVRI